MAGNKVFIGPKLRELRQNRKLTQVELATALGVSASYINLIEKNHRSASLKFLVSLSDHFGLNWRDFTSNDEGLLIADLRQASRDPAFGANIPDIEELRSAAEGAPNLIKGLLNIYELYRDYGQRLAEHNEGLGVQGLHVEGTDQSVHDFFRSNNNYFAALEEIADKSCVFDIMDREEIYPALKNHLTNVLGVQVKQVRDEVLGSSLRYYDPEKQILFLSDGLDHANKTFQLAHMIGLVEHGDVLNDLLPKGAEVDETTSTRYRVELANYFAAAMLMPYGEFFEEAKKERYDVDRLAARYSVSYEQACHRLTTLQKPGQRAIPFFFLRIDRGGNVSKRFNITPIQLARFGGACPKMDIHYCFRVPGRILTQVVEMPDHSRYLTINRTVDRPSVRYSTVDKRLAVALGCPIEYGQETIYAGTANLSSSDSITEIGVNCRLCPRQNCEHRAHDPFFSSLKLDENRRGVTHFES